MSSYLITGASRGLGFEWLQQVSASPDNTVIALVRDKAGLVEKITPLARTNVHVVQADLSNHASLKKSAEEVSSILHGSLDYLIANAGHVSGWSAYDTLSVLGNEPEKLEQDLLQSFSINAIGSIHLFNAYVPLLLKGKGKKVLAISTGLADNEFTAKFTIDTSAPYAISKAALNTVVAKFHAEYAKDGLLFLALSPGLVDTSAGVAPKLTAEQQKRYEAVGAKFGSYAPSFRGPITPEESVHMMLRVLDMVSVEGGYGGDFLSHHGNKQWL